MLDPLNSLWIGDKLGSIERLTMISALEVGHPFRLHSYCPEKLCGVPAGVEVRDANEVIERPALARYLDGGHAALGTDFFRYAMQAKGLGYWVDLDLYFLRPLDFDDDYVFGWEHDTSINGAVLRLPPDSAMVRELCQIPHLNWRPPFYGLRKTAQFYWRRLTEGDLRPENYRWGAFGPAVLTYLAKKHRVAKRAQKRSVFYPILHCEAKMAYGPPEPIESRLTGETRTVHLWSSVLSREARIAPPGSWLDLVCRRHGLTPGMLDGESGAGAPFRHEGAM
ncbi:MAG: hypothetical protein JO288_04470 [Hyphomicrobiales bacterium]|nr:hypothetical protein [Hyphomicrobiales bacterium]